MNVPAFRQLLRSEFSANLTSRCTRQFTRCRLCAWSLRSHFCRQAPAHKLRVNEALEEIKTMDFEIKSDNEYRILFSERSHDSKGWLTQYTVTLYSPNMSGTVRVDNSPYGQSPLQLFQSIENEWKGWKGEKSWGSFEGEFDLSATSDSTGHITLKASLFSVSYTHLTLPTICSV